MSDHPCKYEWEPCNYPPAPGRAYCGPHLEPPHPHSVGHGQPLRYRPDWGPTFHDLICDVCNATWVGPSYEACIWCEVSLENIQLWQAELTLTPPDMDPANLHWPEAMKAWQERLANAIRAGIITKHDASRVWKRAVE